MGYPYDKTYLEQILENIEECEDIRRVFYALRRKYIKDNLEGGDEFSLSIQENFRLLGEAFELESWTLDGISDKYHFIGDVLEALLGSEWENKKKIIAKLKEEKNV